MQQPFTVAAGIEIQQEYLYRWKTVLKPEVFQRLRAHVSLENQSLNEGSDGYDVFRGNDLNAYVFNHLMD